MGNLLSYQKRARDFIRIISEHIKLIAGAYLFPLGDIQTSNVMNFSQDICNYTKEGRLQNLRFDVVKEINRMLRIPYDEDNLENADNRISRYSMQLGKCAVTAEFLTSNQVHCHHKLPRHMGGTDEFNNLVIVHKDVHRFNPCYK